MDHDQDLTQRRTRALANPIYFGEAYIRPYDPNWVEPLPRFGHDMLRHVLANQRTVVVLPPEFLKTTLVSQLLPIWLTYRAVCFGDQLRGMLMSEEEGMAKNNLAVVTWHIENNEQLARDFADPNGIPLVRPSKTEQVWREDAIVVDRPSPSKDPTWQAKGLDSKGVHGRRLDWFVGDDLVTPRNAHSPAMRKKALDLMDLQIETRLVKGHHATVAGNFNDPADLPSELAKRPRWAEFRRPAIHVKGKPWEAATESQLRDPTLSVPTWPSNWTRQRLLVEYEDKPNRFRRIYLLDPRAEYGERLKVSWMTVIRPDETPLAYSRFYFGIDAAPGSAEDDPDFFNVTVGALHNNHCDVIQSLSVRADTPRQTSLIGELHDQYQRLGGGVIAIAISKQTVDKYFGGALRIGRKDLDHKVVPVPTPLDKEGRLEGLGVYAHTGWLRAWHPVWTARTSDPEDQYQELTMMEEWRDFPHGAHDDRLDGLDVMIRGATEFALVTEEEFTIEAVGT